MMKKQHSSAGFTLIELLAVMSIMGILAGLIIGGVRLARQKSANALAQSEIATMEMALESFKSDNGIYPPSTAARCTGSGFPAGPIEISNSGNLYTALAGGPKVYYPFKPTQIAVSGGGITNVLDPYHHPYNYYCNGGALDQTNKPTFDLWSYGKDGLNDTADDITNWRR